MSTTMLTVFWIGILWALSSLHQEPTRLADGRSSLRTKVVQPVYPPEARRAWIQGIVVMDIVIGSKGIVDDVTLLRSIPLLDQAAIEAVRQWEYEPTTRDGVPIPIVTTVSLQFQLPGGDEWLVHPEGTPQLRLHEYGLNISADRSRRYSGTVKNVSAATISGVEAVVSYLGRGNRGARDGDGPPAGVIPPNKLRHAEPEYPREARRQRIEGLVVLEAPIYELGRVGDVRVLRSIPVLDPAAIEALRHWEYEPARRDGIAVPALLIASITFGARDVRLVEAIAAEVGRFAAEPIGDLEPGESRGFAILLPAPGGETREVFQLRFVSDTGESVIELPTSRQQNSLTR